MHKGIYAVISLLVLTLIVTHFYLLRNLLRSKDVARSTKGPTIKVTASEFQSETASEEHDKPRVPVGHFQRSTGWQFREEPTEAPLPSTAELPAAVKNVSKPELVQIKVTTTQLRRLHPEDEALTTTTAPSPTTTTPTIATTLLPEHSVTVVTALLDIGRGYWRRYGRPLWRYHYFMRQVLLLRVPMVVFTDTHSMQFVYEIWNVTTADLPLYRHLQMFRAIIDDEHKSWKASWDSAMKDHPEAKSAEYDLVVNSKPYFLFNASKDNPFDTVHYAWVDAGYGQGSATHFPTGHEWKPIFPLGQISLIKLTPDYDVLARYTLEKLYRQDWAVICGGFLASDRKTIKKFYQAYHWKVVELATQFRSVDDDQTTLTLLINEIPYMFNIVHGDWFDAFRLF